MTSLNGLQTSVQDILLIVDQGGKAQPIGGCAAPGKMVLNYINKEIGQAMRSKAVSNIPLWLLINFLPPGIYLEFSSR